MNKYDEQLTDNYILYYGANTEHISAMIGKVMSNVYCKDKEELIFESTGSVYRFYHSQSCCEGVYIEDICGDLSDLIGSPITQAEVSTKDASGDEKVSECGTWTFYKYATNKGSVTVRWLGTSNGYYSESVDVKIKSIFV